MSLKALHLVFIVVATLLMVLFATWSLTHFFGHDASLLYLAMGIAAVSGAVGLVSYGYWFVKKMKDISYV